MKKYFSIIDNIDPNDPNEPLIYPTFYNMGPNDTGIKTIPYDYVADHIDDFVYYGSEHSDLVPEQKQRIAAYVDKYFPEAKM